MSSLLKNRPASGAAAVAAVAANGATPWIPPQPPAPPAPPAAASLPIMQQPQAVAPPAPPVAAPLPPAAPQYAPPAPAPQYAAPPPPAPVAPAAPQVAPPPPAAPQASVGPILAGAAIQNERYWVNGHLMRYLCSTGGKQAFVPPEGGQPVHIDYNVTIFPEAAAYAPQHQAVAPVAAPPPAPVAAPPPPVPTAQSVAPPPPPAPGTQPAAPKRRGRQPKDPNAAAPAAAPATQTAAPTESTFEGFMLFVNAVPNRPFTDLSSYIHEAVEQMRTQFGVADIRVAPDDSPLGFAKWRGVLAGLVRAEPPPPGTYMAVTKGSEFAEVVVEALWPIAALGSARAF